jgi:alpha-mannosidase
VTNATSTRTLLVVPHTHWEGAVFKTREEYLESGLPNILKALYLLRRYPEYRFVLDQVAYIRPFLERYPEAAAEFRKFVAEGRLEIVGANDVMLDVNVPSGESWIRQVLYGKGYCKRELGLDVKVGWAIDTFGHHAQMPQLLKLAGYDSYWFQRGVRSSDTPSEFVWEGIDGSRIPAFWLALGYGLFYPSPGNLFDFNVYVRDLWESLDRYSKWPERVALAGADVIEPEESLPQMVRDYNREPDHPATLRFAVPTDFESIVARRPERPVVPGELNPVFQGTYSNRIEIKQWLREDERILSTAEKLSALRAVLNLGKDEENLTRAWEPVLFNEAHDLASGTMVDKVYADTIRGYQFSKTLGEDMIETNFEAIASNVDTRAKGNSGNESIPVIVFNGLGWERTDIGQAKIGFSRSDVFSVDVIGPAGEKVPVQLMDAERYGGGGIKDATLAFIAQRVPSLGYAVYQVVPREADSTAAHMAEAPTSRAREITTTRTQDAGSIENEFCRVTLDLWTGALIRLEVKSPAGGWNAASDRHGNVIAEEQDGGDFWELYGNLNGARFTSMTRRIGLPIPGRFHLSDEWVGGDGITEGGPVFSQFHVSHPFGAGSFATTVRLYRGINRVEVQTELVNNDKSVRYRLLVPTSIVRGKRVDEIPFGSIERPEAQELPAQNWVDWTDGVHGVALLNRGLPGNNVADGTLILSLLRSARISAYPFFGGYEPGVSSDLGLELSEKRTFNYAIVPHNGSWQDAAIYRAGLEFNNPLIVRPVGRHGGSLPNRWGLFDILSPNVVTSAFMLDQSGGIIVRLYEARGRSTAGVKVKFRPGFVSASEVNLIGQQIRNAGFRDNVLSFDLHPYEIKTFRLELNRGQEAQ